VKSSRYDIDLCASQAALREVTNRTAALLRSIPDPGKQVPGLDWSVADTAAHLVSDLRLTEGVIAGDRRALEHVAHAAAGSPSERTTASNTRLLEEFSERDLGRLSDMLVDAVEGFLAASPRRSPEETFPNQSGIPMTVPTMTTVVLGEQLVHGLDIARAAGSPWRFSRAEALLVIAGVMALVPEYVDRERAAGVHVVYELRFRGGPRYRIAIENGTATVTPPAGRPDCWIQADPVAFLLLGYGRVGQWSQVLRGRLVAGGRKPWLAPKFSQLLISV
jgi:uncharacterized protein (TIGR03083 family)